MKSVDQEFRKLAPADTRTDCAAALINPRLDVYLPVRGDAPGSLKERMTSTF